VICVSESLRQKAIELGIVDASRTTVLGGGSCNGIDAGRLAPTTEALRRGRRIREKLGIPANVPVIGFVGRLTKDKGISELANAYCELRKKFPELRLLLVGEMEGGDPLTARIRSYLESEPGIMRTGFVTDPTSYYHVMDMLALPTYREGFPTVALEASAAGKPVVAARATGAVDAVVDKVTGILVPVGDSTALASALELLLRDRELAASLGAAGRERVQREFQQERVWEALGQEYSRLLNAIGSCVPVPIDRSETAAEWTTAASR
jgi:glycosyltransferase involved in cell wall biosynthesis